MSKYGLDVRIMWELSPQTGVFQEGDFWPEILLVSISEKGKKIKNRTCSEVWASQESIKC